MNNNNNNLDLFDVESNIYNITNNNTTHYKSLKRDKNNLFLNLNTKILVY